MKWPSLSRRIIGWVCVLIANEKKFELSSNNYNFGKLVSGNSELICNTKRPFWWDQTFGSTINVTLTFCIIKYVRFEDGVVSVATPSKVWSQTPGVGVLSQPQGLWPPVITAITVFLRVLFPNSQFLMTPALAIVSNSLVEWLCSLSPDWIETSTVGPASKSWEQSPGKEKPNHNSHCWEAKGARRGARCTVLLIFVNSKSPQGEGVQFEESWNSCF